MSSAIDRFCEMAGDPITTPEQLDAYLAGKNLNLNAPHSITKQPALVYVLQTGNQKVLKHLIEKLGVDRSRVKASQIPFHLATNKNDDLIPYIVMHPEEPSWHSLRLVLSDFYVDIVRGRVDNLKRTLSTNPKLLATSFGYHLGVFTLASLAKQEGSLSCLRLNIFFCVQAFQEGPVAVHDLLTISKFYLDLAQYYSSQKEHHSSVHYYKEAEFKLNNYLHRMGDQISVLQKEQVNRLMSCCLYAAAKDSLSAGRDSRSRFHYEAARLTFQEAHRLVLPALDFLKAISVKNMRHSDRLAERVMRVCHAEINHELSLSSRHLAEKAVNDEQKLDHLKKCLAYLEVTRTELDKAPSPSLQKVFYPDYYHCLTVLAQTYRDLCHDEAGNFCYENDDALKYIGKVNTYINKAVKYCSGSTLAHLEVNKKYFFAIHQMAEMREYIEDELLPNADDELQKGVTLSNQGQYTKAITAFYSCAASYRTALLEWKSVERLNSPFYQAFSAKLQLTMMSVINAIGYAWEAQGDQENSSQERLGFYQQSLHCREKALELMNDIPEKFRTELHQDQSDLLTEELKLLRAKLNIKSVEPCIKLVKSESSLFSYTRRAVAELVPLSQSQSEENEVKRLKCH